MERGIKTRILNIMLALIFIFSNSFNFVFATESSQQGEKILTVESVYYQSFGDRFIIKLKSQENLPKIKGVSLNGVEFEKGSYSASRSDTNKYFISTFNNEEIQMSDILENAEILIKTDRGDVAINTSNREGNKINFSQREKNDSTSDDTTNTTSGVERAFNIETVKLENDFGRSKFVIKLMDDGNLPEITGVSVNDTEYEKASFYVNTDDTNRYFVSSFAKDKIELSNLGENSKVKIKTNRGNVSFRTLERQGNVFEFSYDDVNSSEEDTTNSQDGNADNNNTANVKIKSIYNNFSRFEITLAEEQDMPEITGITVNGENFVKSSFPVYNSFDTNKYYINSDAKQIQLSHLPQDANVVISTNRGNVSIQTGRRESNGNIEFTQGDSNQDSDTPDGNSSNTQDGGGSDSNDSANTDTPTVEFNAQDITNPFSNDFTLKITPKDKLANIISYEVNGKSEPEKTSKYYILRDGYYKDMDGGNIISFIPRDGSKIVFKLDNGKKYSYQYTRGKGLKLIDNSEAEVKELKIRIRGSFDSAVENQKKYDAISGATGSVTSNKNSNVILEVAEVVQGTEPTREDWKPLYQYENIEIDTANTRVIIDETSNMRGVYSREDSSITLDGVPTKAGRYDVKVILTDTIGRRAESNSLPFKVYSSNEKLVDLMILDNFKSIEDGKYSWDMEPWNIPNFDDDNVVEVPQGLSEWYGSRTSGTYGFIGFPTKDEPSQTLVINDGVDLNLINMKISSSVKIVVKSGGTLRLTDSVLFGNVIVESGGKFQMNYDNKENRFLTGASISGQLQLQDGAIIENALIYSNTNNIAEGRGDSTVINRKMDAVVTATGNVSVVGKVFIKGDEAPVFGEENEDHIVEKGQLGLLVKDGTLDIKENGTLAVYGGGLNAITSNGGSAIRLENGNITGNGELIAIGGNGFGGFGGSGISGSGNVYVDKAFLQGGDTRRTSSEAGKPIEEDILISKNTVGIAENGNKLSSHRDEDHLYYWKSAATQKPNIDVPFGSDKIIKELRTLENENVKVKGNIVQKARLIVTRIDDLPQAIIDKIKSMEDKVATEKYDISIVGGRFIDELSVEIPVISKADKVDVLHLKKDGEIENFEADVVDGKISVDVTELSPFVVLDNDENTSDNNTGSDTDNTNTGDDSTGGSTGSNEDSSNSGDNSAGNNTVNDTDNTNTDDATADNNSNNSVDVNKNNQQDKQDDDSNSENIDNTSSNDNKEKELNNKNDIKKDNISKEKTSKLPKTSDERNVYILIFLALMSITSTSVVYKRK